MKKNNKKGFTLVELVIVVAVMAVLVAVAIPTVGSVVTKAETAVANTNCRTIESMIKLGAAEVAKAGKGTIDDKGIDKYLTDAQLGIDGTYYYDVSTGNCSTEKSGDYMIVLDTKATKDEDIVKVTPVTQGGNQGGQGENQGADGKG